MTKNPRKQLAQRRAAYALFEKMILDLYDRKSLTLDQLDHIADQYRWLPIGASGNHARLTGDGKDLCQVCIELVDPSFPSRTMEPSGDHEEYWEQELRKWEDIVRWRWNWHAYDVPHLQWQQEKKAA